MKALLLVSLLACCLGLLLPGAMAQGHATDGAAQNAVAASAPVQQVATWVVASRNNQTLPFLIVDKAQARVFLFHADGKPVGSAPALLGLARGDDSVPGIGERKLASPGERTTPAGRFASALGRNLLGEEILWLDYDAGVSMHRLIPGTPQEQRARRLASPTPTDNRITYGCINVPTAFFEQLVRPAFKRAGGIVYVLPETRPLQNVFGAYGFV